MIIRILEDAQYEIADDNAEFLKALDVELDQAIQAGDEERFEQTHEALLHEVHTLGHPLDPDTIKPSDLALPAKGSTLAEVRKLLDASDQD